MSCRISVIIPNRNGAPSITACLEAAFASSHNSFEVIVVDDCSEDASVSLIRQFPCRLIQLATHQGAAVARNRGAASARGEILFFTDADCVILKDTLSLAEECCRSHGRGVIIGGTYTSKPYDENFYSLFQSVFIHSSETKNIHPDYIASHAMALYAETFHASPGFPENFPLPIIEDVAFSHALKQQGLTLRMQPQLQVRHIFNFSFGRSLKNAFRKAHYWTIYSLEKRELLADSGCASRELKTNVFSLLSLLLLAVLSCLTPHFFVPFLPLPLLCNLTVNRRLLAFFYQTGGFRFFLGASLYYMSFYAAAVGFGGVTGLFHFFSLRGQQEPLHTSPLWQESK